MNPYIHLTQPLIFDSHAHYQFDAFDRDRDELLSNLKKDGVCGAVICGSTLENSRAAVALAEKYPNLYAAAGVHPGDVNEAGHFAEFRNELESLLKSPKVVALGEIGLDYHYDGTNRELQAEWLGGQLELAAALKLPVLIHDRDAHADTLAVLKEFKPRGVVHCFSGSPEMAEEVTRLGMYIGLGGSVTFKNAKTQPEVAKRVPIERLLLETDAPYLAPAPFRGKRCDSRHIAITAAKIAEVRGEDVEYILRVTRENARGLFNLTSDFKFLI
ncbi:MAG: TatD family hydrolase [Oscillospiraceae bacterium]|nr:TatD family hydrolase [Oscillospiraceae bacterium]